jgi:1-acyl-sn-glycerol-3-phosphate acyltransferase
MKALTSMMSSMFVFTSTLAYLRRARDPQLDVETLKRQWAEGLLQRLNIQLEMRGKPSLQPSLLFVGNHISYLDILILMAVAPEVAFVSKKEIASWPIIGMGARKIKTIFVERGCQNNRKAARETISREVQNGARIALFPSGTTTMDESKPWKLGVFEIAKEMKVPIQPFRLRYTPLRKAAFINEDIFPLHLFQLAKSGEVKAEIEFHPPVMIQDPVASCLYWQNWSKSTVEPLAREEAPSENAHLNLHLAINLK